MSTIAHVRVHAPATLSNLGPGFDVLGLAVEQPGDYVEAEWSDAPGVEIVEVQGAGGELTTDPTRNVVGIAATAALRAFDARAIDSRPAGVRLWLDKGMPLASGLGGSAASSVGGALAVSELLGGVFDRDGLIACALEGERVVSGGVHADNVVPCVAGGIVLIRSCTPMELLSLPVPDALRVGRRAPARLGGDRRGAAVGCRAPVRDRPGGRQPRSTRRAGHGVTSRGPRAARPRDQRRAHRANPGRRACQGSPRSSRRRSPPALSGARCRDRVPRSSPSHRRTIRRRTWPPAWRHDSVRSPVSTAIRMWGK